MIGLPYNVPLMSQIMPNQSVPVQTTQNNFQPFQPPQPIGQQMQTTPSFAYPTNPQDHFKQPFYQLHQADVLVANQQYTPNLLPPKYPYLPTFQTQPAISPIVQTQQPSYNPLPQNVLDQIRNTISSAAPIFILPSGCHQATNQPSNAMNRESVTQQTDFNRPICCPPSFCPYPFPIPMFDPFGSQAGCKDGPRSCSCCHKKRNTLDSMNYPLNCCCNIYESEEHRCTATIDDTICSKRNCPSSISLQALASQLLSVPGIISCALTRLILRKVPGSNITNTMEDIMEKAQKSIGALNKDQLLVESRNAQQVNALINLHMTTTPPANIIPLLTLLQLKVNVLKAQVENLINKKVMECQGYGFEVETSGPIDPTVLTMKTNAELRQLLSALRQKECDERVNANFSPYHSQRVIAEARLNNVQAKIRQVEAEFERRRCMTVPTPTLTSRIVQQFSESRCMFGFAHANIFEPYVQGSALDSPDPFTPCLRNPRKLYLKPREPGQGTTVQNDGNRTTSEGTSICKDTGTGEGTVNTSEDKDVQSKSSADTCSCEGTSSEESLGEDKKKLRLKIDVVGKVTISYDDNLRDVSLLRLAPNVATKIRKVCKKDRGRGRRVKEVKRVSEGKEKVDEEIKEVDKEMDPRDKLYAKKESIDSEDYELFIFEEDPDDTDTDSEDYELFIFEEDPDDKDTDSENADDETQIKEDIKKEPESIQSVRILDFTDTPIKKKSESVEIIEISDSTDIPTKKEPESVEVIEIRDSTDIPIKKEPESVKTSISPSADIPSKEEPESKKEIKADVNVPIKEEPKDKDEEKKSPQCTTDESIKVGIHVAELYVEPKGKSEAEKAEKTEFYIYVNAEPEIESTTMSATYVEPKIKTQPATQVIQVKEDSHVKTTPAAVVRVEPAVKTEEGEQTRQLVVVPKVKTEDITLVPQIKADPHVKKIPAEKLHMEPAAKTEEGKQQGPSHGAPKVKTETITLVPQIKADPHTKTATLHMEPQVKAEPVTMVPQMKAGPVTIVPQATAVPHVRKNPAEMLHVEPAVGTEGREFFAVPMVKEEQELTNLEGNKVLETREPGESWKTQFARTRRKFKSKLKEDVSKNQRTGSEAAAQPQTSEAGHSSDLQETAFYMIKPKATKKKVIRVLRKENGPVSNEENNGSQKKNNKERNVQFVSMMTRVEYNRCFDDFWGWNINERNSEKIEDSSKNDSSQDIEKINSINEDRAHSHAESINPSIDNQQCESATEMNSEICKNTLVEKMFPKVPRKNDKKLANGLNCFPPLKRTEFKSATSEATFSHNKIESSVSKTIWNRSIFHRRDWKTETNIVSRIYSMLENQFLSFSSLFNNIPNIQDLMSNLNFNKLSGNTFNENNPNQQMSNTENNKRELNKKDDWILFPSATNTCHSDEHATSGGHCVSSYEGSRNVRKIKHSIIVDKEKDNYILIGGSNSGQLQALSRNGFKRPDKVRRSLIIRSRLKNPGNSKNEHSRPFTVFRRLKRSKKFLSEGMKQTEGKLEFREKLLPLPEATKALETVDDDNLNDNKENDGRAEMSQEAVSQDNSKHDNDLNNNCIDTSIDHTLTRSDDYRCRDK